MKGTDNMSDIIHKLQKNIEAIQSIINDESLIGYVYQASTLIIDSLKKGNKAIFFGNGGSAADSQHLAAELVGNFRHVRKALASIALTTDTSILTSVGNDYGFEMIYARQIEALCTERDIFIGISTSGNSENLVAAIKTAKRLGMFTAGLLGRTGGKMLALCDASLLVASSDTPRIQEAHILIGHILCELLDSAYRNE